MDTRKIRRRRILTTGTAPSSGDKLLSPALRRYFSGLRCTQAHRGSAGTDLKFSRGQIARLYAVDHGCLLRGGWHPSPDGA